MLSNALDSIQLNNTIFNCLVKLIHCIIFPLFSLPFGKTHTEYFRKKGHKATFLELDFSAALLKKIMKCDIRCIIITYIYVHYSTTNPSKCCRNPQKGEKHALRKTKTNMAIVAFHKICSFCSQKLFNTSQVSKGMLPLSLSCSESHFRELIKMGLQILFWKI